MRHFLKIQYFKGLFDIITHKPYNFGKWKGPSQLVKRLNHGIMLRKQILPCNWYLWGLQIKRARCRHVHLFSFELSNVPEQSFGQKTAMEQGWAGFPLGAALAPVYSEKLSSLKGLKKWPSPAEVCDGLASTEEGFALGMGDNPARASPKVTQTAYHHHSGIWHFSSNLSPQSTSSGILSKILNHSGPQFLQLQNGIMLTTFDSYCKYKLR